MKSLYIVECKTVGLNLDKIKIIFLHYPSDFITIPFNNRYTTVKKWCGELLREYGFKPLGFGYDEKKQAYLYVCENYEPLREIKKDLQLSEKQRGWHKEHYNYNKAEKWEIKPQNRKVKARNA